MKYGVKVATPLRLVIPVERLPVTADELKDLLNDLLRVSTETYWRINQRHEEAFLTHTINNSKVYYWPESGEVKTHSNLANAFMRDKLGRRPDRIDPNGNSGVHVWVVRNRKQ